MKLNFKKIALITTMSICLTGCSKRNNNEKSTDNIFKAESTVDLFKEEITKKVKATEQITEQITEQTTEQITTINNEEKESFTNEEKIEKYFTDVNEEMKELVNEEKWEDIKSKGKEYVIKGIDFVFFDEPIKGVYFDDLTDEGKRLVILNIDSVKEVVEQVNPNFLSSLNEKYQSASLYIEEKYLSSLDKIKEYLGEEKYNSIKEKKDEVKEKFSEGKEKAKSFLKKKYSDWKNK